MSRAGLWTQLAAGFALLEVALWTSGQTQTVVSWIVFFYFVIAVILQGRPASVIGIGASGFGRALLAVPFAGAGGALLLLLGWGEGWLQPLYGPGPVWAHMLGYAAWALFQQFMLQSFFYCNLEALLGAGKAPLWTAAGLFAIAHIPNPVLVPATFVAAMFFVWMFRKTRNIYPLGIAHALLGLALAVSAPDHVLRHMRVGASYFRYHSSTTAKPDRKQLGMSLAPPKGKPTPHQNPERFH